MLVGYWWYYIDYSQGTNAIRYLNNSWYADPVLYPSWFYAIGLVLHETQTYDEYESDKTQDEDIPIESIDDEEIGEDGFIL